MNVRMVTRAIGAMALMACVSVTTLANSADVPIADFEGETLGSAPGVPVISVSGNVTVEDGSRFVGEYFLGAPGHVIEGQFAYLTTGPSSTGAGSSGIDRTGAFGPENDIATMTVPFSTTELGWVRWGFVILSGESDGNPDPIEIVLDGRSVFRKGILADNGDFPGYSNFFASEHIGPYGSFYDKVSGLNSIFGVSPGSHTLEFFVGDAVTTTGDAALLVDRIAFEPIPEPATLALLALGGFALIRRRRT